MAAHHKHTVLPSFVQVLAEGNAARFGSMFARQMKQLFSLQALSAKAADGFLLHPGVSQAAVTNCSSIYTQTGRASLPMAGSCMLLPIRAVATAAGTLTEACKATISVRHGPELAAIFSGLQHIGLRELQPSDPWAQPISTAAELLYYTEWQAIISLMAADRSAIVHPDLAFMPSWFQRNAFSEHASCLAHAAISAGAGILSILQTRHPPLQHLSVQTAGSCPPQSTTRGGLAVAAATVAGIMRTVPLEMPRLSVQLQGLDPAYAAHHQACASTFSVRTSGPAASCPHTDVHGCAARQGALHTPRLQYSTWLPRSSGHARIPAMSIGQSCFVITGGLGGLGLMVSSWLTNSDICSLILVSRTGSIAAATTMLTAPTLVEMTKADVAVLADAQLVALAAQRQHWRHNGTLHTAGMQASSWQSEAD